MLGRQWYRYLVPRGFVLFLLVHHLLFALELDIAVAGRTLQVEDVGDLPTDAPSQERRIVRRGEEKATNIASYTEMHACKKKAERILPLGCKTSLA